MSDKAIAKQDEERQVEPVKQDESVYIPKIDISESNAGIELALDMPGADSGSVDITVEKNTLTIEGSGIVETPEGYELVESEYSIGKYRRDFTLSNDVDSDKIKARAKDGVLYVTIPKRAETKARKIKIQS